MDYTNFGQTGLQVSVAGLGCGGNSRLGLGTGGTEDDAVRIVRAAHEDGVTFFDTAAAYGTEHIIGRAAAEIGRDKIVIASKAIIRSQDGLRTPDDLRQSLETSLTTLGTDVIDLFSLHAVVPPHYEHARSLMLPVLEAARAEGKIRHFGITESAPRDPDQEMLTRAAADSAPWEAAMLAFSMINQRAGQELIPALRSRGMGIQVMFAVRNIFSRPDVLRATLADLVASGSLPQGALEASDPLGFLREGGSCETVTEAAYRFARHESGGDLVLFGTGNEDHLRQNIRDILKPPLPAAHLSRLRDLFGSLGGVGLVLPDSAGASASPR